MYINICTLCRRQLLAKLKKQAAQEEVKDTDPQHIESRELKCMSTPDVRDSEDSSAVQCESKVKEGMYVSVENKESDDDIEDKLVIDNTGNLDVGRSLENLPDGRFMMNLAFYTKELYRTYLEHKRGIDCPLDDWVPQKYRICGLKAQLFFKCRMCNHETSIWTEPKKADELDINIAAVVTTITAGIGYSTLQEVCAGLNVHCMSAGTYMKNRDIIVDEFEKTALEEMKKAGEREKQLAIENNDTINGIPYITVVADGSWSKRTYGKAYDSLSGVGAIIGYRTKKVLFIGIRNKYCAVCDVAERKGCEVRAHKCYKNFDRNVSSTRMESDAITEGFNHSLEMHGLIYKTLIADGDSNVYQSIKNNNPYREQMVMVEKIECTNHLFRNLSRKLTAVAETTQPKTQRKRGFVETRNVVKHNVKKIHDEIKYAISVRQTENEIERNKATELRKDILNIPSHVFGEHKRCKKRGRDCEDNNKNKKNYVPYLKLYGLYQKIETAIEYLAAHSESLLRNVNNNAVEVFNSIVCKFISGKRILHSKRGSHTARYAGAVLQYNTQQALTEVHKGMKKSVPATVEKLEKQRQLKIARSTEARQIDGKRKKFKRVLGTDGHYGPQSQQPDLPDHVFEQLRQNHIDKLIENAKDWKQIERQTTEQSESEVWLALRREMLTASNFGMVCRLRPTTSCVTTVKNILYPPPVDTVAMKYGRDQEEIARKELAAKLNKEIKLCGLFIDRENACLGASPDGLIDEDGLVEIKCPLTAENLTAEEAVEKLPPLKGIFEKHNPGKLNRNHRFFYQIQGQLNITQRQYCIFAIWTKKSIKIVHVDVDNAFWKNEMLPLLTRFYYECMLPEIVDSRYNRHMPIRNPQYIIEAKEEAEKKAIHRKSNQRKAIENKNTNKEKQCKYDFSPQKTTIASIVAVENMQEDDDCVIVTDTYKNKDINEENTGRWKDILDNSLPDISLVKENVLPTHSKINDESLDRLLRVIRETSSFETQNVLYIAFPHMIEASHSDKSLQIIGGNCSDHWRCLFLDSSKLYVYDSLPNCTYDKLTAEEKYYIKRRYPQIGQNDIIFEQVDTQPDGTSCGIYAAAFATTVALGGNPCNERYSTNIKCMRQHFVKIIEDNKLQPFPRK